MRGTYTKLQRRLRDLNSRFLTLTIYERIRIYRDRKLGQKACHRQKAEFCVLYLAWYYETCEFLTTLKLRCNVVEEVAQGQFFSICQGCKSR